MAATLCVRLDLKGNQAAENTEIKYFERNVFLLYPFLQLNLYYECGPKPASQANAGNCIQEKVMYLNTNQLLNKERISIMSLGRKFLHKE